MASEIAVLDCARAEACLDKNHLDVIKSIVSSHFCCLFSYNL